MWKEYFDQRSQEKGIWYKTIQPEPLSIPWIDNCSLSRPNSVIAMRLRSGHIPSRKFTFLMGIADSPNCETCGAIEDVYHVLMECERNEMIRGQFTEHVDVQNVGECNSILSAPTSEAAKVLYKIYSSQLSTT